VDNYYVADEIQNPINVRVERQALRYPFVASVELVDLQSDLQFQERVTALSLYGCGVTASKPLPAGTKLRVRNNQQRQHVLTINASCFGQDGHSVSARDMEPPDHDGAEQGGVGFNRASPLLRHSPLGVFRTRHANA
jgi:hypothetical protein